MVADVQGAQDSENRNVIMYKFHGKVNQQWVLIYKKDWKRDPIKGEWNKDYGFRVGVFFHVQSHLRWGKYLESMNREVNLKTPNGRAE